MIQTTDATLTGHYEPNKPGAASLRDARPLWIGGKHVTADVLGRTITVFLGCDVVWQGELPANVMHRGQVNGWVATVATNIAADRARYVARELPAVSGVTGTFFGVFDRQADKWTRDAAGYVFHYSQSTAVIVAGSLNAQA